jgi:hypothetical protein
MRQKIADVRARLSTALRDQFQKEISRSGDRIRESIAPYSRFIRAEGDKLKVVEQELREIGHELASLRARVERPEEVPNVELRTPNSEFGARSSKFT